MDDRARCFAAVYEQYYDLVFRICLDQLYYNVENAEDVTEDVFLTLLSKPKKINNKNIKGWLIRTAKNKIKEFKRKIAKQGFHQDIYEYAEILTASDADDMEEQIAQKANMLNLDNDIIQSLRPPEQELLHYIREHKLTYAEIGEKMGLTESEVTMRAYRLYKKVKKLVAEEVEKLREW